jgi:hypothetical protein
MPEPLNITLAASPALVSSAFFVGLGDRPIALLVPSLTTPAAVRVQASATSGGPVFVDVSRPDGSGLVFVATSGSGPAWATMELPTAFARISVSSAQTNPTSFLVLTLHR